MKRTLLRHHLDDEKRSGDRDPTPHELRPSIGCRDRQAETETNVEPRAP
jgi:hypothetical protein